MSRQQLTVHFLVELLVQHHASVEIATVANLFFAIARTPVQDGSRNRIGCGRSSVGTVSGDSQALEMTRQFLIVAAGRRTAASGHTFGTSRARTALG